MLLNKIKKSVWPTLLLLAACSSNADLNTTETDKNESIITKEQTEAAEKQKIANTLTELETKDSIKPASAKTAEKLTGFDKDSALMRIAFQQQANAMNRAYMAADYNAYVNYILPSLVKKQGGKAALISKLGSEQKANPLNFEYIKSGPIDDLGEVIDEKENSSGWYCLMPHKSAINTNGNIAQARGYMIGYSPDKKNFYFIDISRIPDEKVFFILPDLQYIFPQLPKR